MKYLTILLITCLSFSSCNNKEKGTLTKYKQDFETIKVDMEKEYKKKKFPNTNNYMAVQLLEDNEEHPIGQVDKLRIDANRFYILDATKARALFIYSRDGKLLSVINSVGNGPGEFVSPQDFDVDKKTGNIIIQDVSTMKFLIYSPNGKFIREFKYNFFITQFALDDDGNILVNTGNIPSKDNLYNLRKIDSSGNIVKNIFLSDSSTIGMTFNSRNPLQQCDEEMFYMPTLSNNIYLLENDDPVLAYQVDFGKNWPSKDFCESVKDMHPLKIRQLMFDNNYVCFLNYAQTKDVLHIDFFQGKRYSFYYNKKTKQQLLISMDDDRFSPPLTTYNDEFVFCKYHEKTGALAIVLYTVNFDLS